MLYSIIYRKCNSIILDLIINEINASQRYRRSYRNERTVSYSMVKVRYFKKIQMILYLEKEINILYLGKMAMPAAFTGT